MFIPRNTEPVFFLRGIVFPQQKKNQLPVHLCRYAGPGEPREIAGTIPKNTERVLYPGKHTNRQWSRGAQGNRRNHSQKIPNRYCILANIPTAGKLVFGSWGAQSNRRKHRLR